MSQELKASVLHLIKEANLLEVQEHPTITPIQDIKLDDLLDECKHSEIYHDLAQNLDKLMVIQNSSTASYEQVKQELLSSGKISFMAQNGEPEDEDILKYLRHMQEIRRLIIDSSTMTLPVLRSVHQVEGLPTKEAGIAAKLERRDELTESIIRLQSQIENNRKVLIKLTHKNLSKFETSKHLTSLLLETKNNDIQSDNPKYKEELEKNLAIAQEKSFDLAEQIQAFIVENGLNWSQDETLREIVLYCGEIYR